jgi:DNA-directed RNA polymerase beta subunit
VLSTVFPIKDFSDKAEIDFVKYELEEPKYDTDECQHTRHDVCCAAARDAAPVGVRC